MTAYQDTPFYYVDSPLNQPEDNSYWWAEAAYPNQHDPMTAVQQRMMLILSAAVIFVLAFGSRTRASFIDTPYSLRSAWLPEMMTSEASTSWISRSST